MVSIKDVPNTATPTAGSFNLKECADDRLVKMPIAMVKIAWLSNGSGAATGTLNGVSGYVVGVGFKPGTPAPSNHYAVTVVDEFAQDVINANGADLSDTVPTSANLRATAFPISGALTIAVASAGSAKRGTIYLYVSNKL